MTAAPALVAAAPAAVTTTAATVAAAHLGRMTALMVAFATVLPPIQISWMHFFLLCQGGFAPDGLM